MLRGSWLVTSTGTLTDVLAARLYNSKEERRQGVGLKAALITNQMEGDVSRVSPLRMYDAVNVVLSYQNHDGGWATYENTRSFHALEVAPPLCLPPPPSAPFSACCLSLHRRWLPPRGMRRGMQPHLTHVRVSAGLRFRRQYPILFGIQNGRILGDEMGASGVTMHYACAYRC